MGTAKSYECTGVKYYTPKNIEQFKTLPLVQARSLKQTKTLEIMKGIKTALADQSMKLAEFSINDRWAWKIKLTTGTEILPGAK